jgi:hypothetical protein
MAKALRTVGKVLGVAAMVVTPFAPVVGAALAVGSSPPPIPSAAIGRDRSREEFVA